MKVISHRACFVALAILFFSSLAFGADAPSNLKSVKNIFVDSFGDKPGASDLRAKIISELKKSGSFHVVEDESAADAVLAGVGEVWIKGHYSMNPRDRSVNSDATAVYAGYLSVELKGRNGETLWSYLAPPHSSDSGNISRDFARLVVRNLASATIDSTPANPPGGSDPVSLTAAGATFPYPLYAKWFEAFHKRFPETGISYDAVGSETGIQRLESGAIDFAGSDIMIPADEYFAGGKPRFLRFPATMGAVVPVYNLPDMPRELRFTPEILAGIYLGKIKKWNDPEIREVNRGAVLPDREIAVIYRTDGSGSSFVWTDYLAKVSPEWKSTAGAGSSPRWPVGAGAEGNEGVAKLVRETSGTIGYVEYIYAVTNHMSYGSVRNSAGKFVSPDLASILAAARGSSNRVAEDFQTSLTNAPGVDAYPIASFTWFVVPARIDDPQKKRAIKEFLQWMLGPGQNQAAALGYVSIAPDVLLREQHMLERF
jgi:phosphate ABC transporter phosphate-binding protein